MQYSPYHYYLCTKQPKFSYNVPLEKSTNSIIPYRNYLFIIKIFLRARDFCKEPNNLNTISNNGLSKDQKQNDGQVSFFGAILIKDLINKIDTFLCSDRIYNQTENRFIYLFFVKILRATRERQRPNFNGIDRRHIYTPAHNLINLQHQCIHIEIHGHETYQIYCTNCLLNWNFYFMRWYECIIYVRERVIL